MQAPVIDQASISGGDFQRYYFREYAIWLFVFQWNDDIVSMKLCHNVPSVSRCPALDRLSRRRLLINDLNALQPHQYLLSPSTTFAGNDCTPFNIIHIAPARCVAEPKVKSMVTCVDMVNNIQPTTTIYYIMCCAVCIIKFTHHMGEQIAHASTTIRPAETHWRRCFHYNTTPHSIIRLCLNAIRVRAICMVHVCTFERIPVYLSVCYSNEYII